MNERAAPCAGGSYNRRGFVSLASGCLLCGLGIPAARAGTDRPIDVGTLKDYTRDEISEKFIQSDIFVIRHKGRLFAATAICPHRAGYLLRDPQKPTRIICASHEWTFDAEGALTRGSGNRGLDRFAISVNDKGRIIVDTSREFHQEQWGDKASFIAIK